MNDLKSNAAISPGPMCERKMTIIDRKIEQLESQNKSLDCFMSDFNDVVGRLRAIGLRLNSVEHPDNRADKSNGVGVESERKKPLPVDGVVGQLTRVIDARENLLHLLNNDLFSSLLCQVSYIEDHI